MTFADVVLERLSARRSLTNRSSRFSLVLVNDRCSEKAGSQAIFDISDAIGVIDVIIGVPCSPGEALHRNKEIKTVVNLSTSVCTNMATTHCGHLDEPQFRL